MCLNPVLIENVNYNAFSRKSKLGFLKDTTSRYIYRPCGTCAQCLQLKQVYFIQRTQCETFENDLFYCTLTYNQKWLPSMNVNGYNIKYARYHDVRLLIQRLRDLNIFGSDFKYIAVSEFGGERHRPHWHLLFSVPKIKNESFANKISREQRYYNDVLNLWAENVGTRSNPVYERRLTLVKKYGRSTYDFHYVNPSLTKDGELDVAFYITKYVLKPNDYVGRLKSALYFNLSDTEYPQIWNEVKPRLLSSKGWGSPDSDIVANHIRLGIDFAIANKSPFPYFINPVSGQTFPLCPYFKNRFLTLDDHQNLQAFSDQENLTDYDNMTYTYPEYTYEQKVQIEKRFKKIQKMVALKDSHCDYLNLRFEDLKSNNLIHDSGQLKTIPWSVDDFTNDWEDS